jgi:hypothetical protein
MPTRQQPYEADIIILYSRQASRRGDTQANAKLANYSKFKTETPSQRAALDSGRGLRKTFEASDHLHSGSLSGSDIRNQI